MTQFQEMPGREFCGSLPSRPDGILSWMTDRTKKNHRKLRINQPYQALVLGAGIQYDQRINALALHQVQITVSPMFTFDGFDQQLVPSGVANATNPEH